MTKYPAIRSPDLEPMHPGELLREVVLPALRLSVTVMAAKLGVSRQMLHNLLAEKSAVSPEMALRLGKFCGNGPALWLNLQRRYDLWHAERALKRVLAKIDTEHVPVMPELAER